MSRLLENKSNFFFPDCRQLFHLSDHRNRLWNNPHYPNPLALELSDRGKDVEDQATGRRCRVDVFRQGPEAHAARLDDLDNVKQVGSERARRSYFVTTMTSPSRSWPSRRSSSGRLRSEPLILSEKMRCAPDAFSASSWASRFWSSVETRA